jgi:predicted phosphoribosyltransferase
MENTLFANRREAGRLLSERLIRYADTNTLLLGIPRGGVVVAHEISKSLHLPMEIILSKKIGHPFQPEYAIGSVSADHVMIHDRSDVSQEYIDEQVEEIRKSIEHKYNYFNSKLNQMNLQGKNVIIIDDGIATGSTIINCIHVLRKKNAKKIIVAVPIAPNDAVKTIQSLADEFICLHTAEHFGGVGEFYAQFEQVNDWEVIELLQDRQIVAGQ